MMRIQRTSLTLTILGVLLPIATGLAQAQGQDPGETNRKTYVISGSVGLAGVKMQIHGFPKELVTDSRGTYTVNVPEGWAGEVRPAKDGYEFSPAAMRYTPVKKDYTEENFRARVVTFTISGKTGVAGAVMKGLPGDPITDTNGSYSVTVDYGWTRRVVPVKEGHTFKPAQQIYQAVTRSYTDQDYKASVLTYTLSGHAGIAGVEMRGLPGHVVTDRDGHYRVEIPYGWSGTVAPTKRGCRFEPARRNYSRVRADMQGQDYEVVSLKVATPSSLGGGRPAVLVIPTSGVVDAQVVAQMEEDMQVMLEILRDRLSESRMDLGGLIDYGDFFGGQSGEALYLEGYGVVFVMTVDFPLSFPSEQASEGEPEREVDPVWQRARQKLRSPSIKYRYGAGRRSAAAEGISLEEFQKELVEALRHAANVRHIASSDRIILTVIGQDERGVYGYRGSAGAYGGGYGGGSRSASGGSSGRGRGRTYAHSETYNTRGDGLVQTSSGDGDGNVKRNALGDVIYEARRAGAGPTVLTMQTTKADVDAYATGEIDVEQFRSRVKVLSY